MPKLIIMTSEECHYSIYKFAAFLGIGEENVHALNTNDVGQIVPENLESKIVEVIQSGAIPLMVVATLGKYRFKNAM